MRNSKLFLFAILSMFMGLTACTNKDNAATTGTTSHYYDPQIPGGTILSDTAGVAGKILNLAADVSVLEQIKLTWQVPPIYKTMGYEIKIYKKKGNDSTFVLPDPADQYSASGLYLRASVVGESYLDQNGVNSSGETVVNVEQNEIYTYWLYIHITGDNEKWGPGVKIVVTSKSPTDTFKFPSVATFWNNMLWDIGYAPSPANNPLISLTTMNPGVTSPENPTGGIALAYSGNLMYYADTQNNRVVIYTRGLAYKCDSFKDTDPATYYACTYQYSGAPLSAVGVLGQDKVGADGLTSTAGRMSCQDYQPICGAITSPDSCDPDRLGNSSICSWVQDDNIPNGGYCTAMKRCLTAPSRLTVQDDHLFISDAGNNRIVVYYNPITTENTSTLPIKGHVKDNGSGIAQSVDGGPLFVVGKKGLTDATVSYPVGKAALKNPGGVAVKGDDLYIADTGNNRVVKVKDYKSHFDCESSEDQWGNLPTDPGYIGGKCQFQALLGQKNFFERWAFKEGAGQLNPGDVGYDGINCNPVTTTYTSCESPGVNCTQVTSSTSYCDSPYILYNNNCAAYTSQPNCSIQSACNWIPTNSTCNTYTTSAQCTGAGSCYWNGSSCGSVSGSCSLKPEATLRTLLDQNNANKPGKFLARYFRAPSEIMFTSTIPTNNCSDHEVQSSCVSDTSCAWNISGYNSDTGVTSYACAVVPQFYFLVSSNENASVTSPLGTSEIRGRALVWVGNPFPDTDAPDPSNPPLTKCYAGGAVSNFDIPNSECHADRVIGQSDFASLLSIANGGDYGNQVIGLKALNGLAVRDTMLFGVDGSNNKVYFWQDFTDTNAAPGIPPTSTVLNPNGRINPNTGRYLPVLKGISDIQITPNNLIYVSDPLNSRVYEVRAYDYETN